MFIKALCKLYNQQKQRNRSKKKAQFLISAKLPFAIYHYIKNLLPLTSPQQLFQTDNKKQ